MNVIYFQRRPRIDSNYSVENLFEQVRKELPKSVVPYIKILSFHSNGIFKRIFISLEAAFSQMDINHVTGDINFIALFLSKKRTLLTILDVGFMKHPNPITRLLLKYFWITLPVKRSGVVTAISNATKLEILKYVRVDPNKIRVVYVPILTDFSPAPKIFNKAKPRILQVGTSFNKNVYRLVTALEGIPCHLEIIGAIRPDLEQALKSCGIEYSNSKNISNQEIILKYIEADVVSFVSTYEGFGMPIVEANAVGRVVVTSNILSMPEVAGNAAHLVDPFDNASIREGLLKVISDEQYRQQLISNGFENCKRFDVSLIASQYASLYQELYANR
jgi:glycosyltransferase involved in cell wall biosynthesis